MKVLKTTKILSILILFCLIIVFFFDIIFLGKTLSTSSLLPGITPEGPYRFSGLKPSMPFSYDTGGNAWINEPNPYIINKTLADGSLPLWNPAEGLGMPAIGNLNSEVFNPLKLFLNIFPSPFLQDIYFLLRLLIMGVFTFLFFVDMRLSAIASLFGAILFMLSGYSMWWINLHPLSSIMYIPSFFYFYERWRNTKEIWNLFFLSLMIAFSIFGGKIPDVMMGLSLLFLYASYCGIRDGGLKGLTIGVGRFLMVSISGVLIASAAFLPFLELNSLASPLAKALRTGSASHTLPLVTSISLWQPLFLGWENYLYSSWLKWNPHAMVFYTGTISLIFLIYSLINLKVVKNTLPFNLFFILLFLQIYGLLPLSNIGNIPIYSSMNFLKYNSMLHFSIAVISANCLDNLIKNGKRPASFLISLFIVSGVIFLYFYFLYYECPDDMEAYLKTLVSLSLIGIAFFGALYYFLKGGRRFGIITIGILIFELFLYMPREHPDRYHPYVEPEYIKILKAEGPYRIIGDGNSIPPLVSSAVGLNDIRGMNVLIQRDYYNFFQHLISFSIPYTNAPEVIVASTSPYIDLLGVRYIVSTKELVEDDINGALDFNIKSMRWIRLFDSMIHHSLKGWASYNYVKVNEDKRFSFIFPSLFEFNTKVRVSEPYLVAGFTLISSQEQQPVKIKVNAGDKSQEISAFKDKWVDLWIDISEYIGKEINITIRSEDYRNGNIALGNFGLSPGLHEEKSLYDRLLPIHKREFGYLKKLGIYNGLNIYENVNVMKRAFVLSDATVMSNIGDIIKELQKDFNFKKALLLTEDAKFRDIVNISSNEKSKLQNEDNVVIKKYSPNEILIEVESKGGILILSDYYYPGWEVKVNGKREDIVRAFGILRGVVIDKGKNHVQFYYNPMIFYLGISISSVVLIVWILYLYYYKRNKLRWLKKQ